MDCASLTTTPLATCQQKKRASGHACCDPRDRVTAALTGVALGLAVARGLPMSIFTADLFATGNDEDNRAAVRAVPRDQLDLVGLAVHGPRNAIDKIVKGARMHP